jgi:two-component system, chemotaxis family, response regulator PixG
MNSELMHVPSAIEPQLRFDPIGILHGYRQQGPDGYLKIQHATVTWWVYRVQGEIIYITHSVDPVDRIDSHLRRLSHTIPALTAEVRSQVRHSLEAHKAQPDGEYKTICALIHQAILTQQTVQDLCQVLSQEALESLLSATSGTSQIYQVPLTFPDAFPLNLTHLLKNGRSRISEWLKFSPLVWSPYQRPYLMPHAAAVEKLPLSQQENLGRILRGFSFRQLGILLQQDEISLVQRLFPLIQQKAIVLRDPQTPYDQLPKWEHSTSFDQREAPVPPPQLQSLEKGGTLLEANPIVPKRSKIACDSPAILQTIERFLGKEEVNLKIISNSVTALLEIMRFKPDLILMDVGMPQVDGYELCKLIRRHQLFKTTPIIMVTGNTGLIDRAKAKLAGATDYMTKPFTQNELLTMVFRHVRE